MTVADKDRMQEIQIIDQNLQQLAQQKQSFQSQLLEVEGALKELKTSQGAYKVIGSIMVKTDPAQLSQELAQKQEVLNVRINNIDKQEEKLNARGKELRKDLHE